jgi:hypothetical protein
MEEPAAHRRAGGQTRRDDGTPPVGILSRDAGGAIVLGGAEGRDRIW